MPAGVPMDPWTAGIMGLTSIAAAPPPSMTSTMNAPNVFDNSGFVVNVGGGSASSVKTALPSAAQAVQAAGAGLGALLGNPVFIIAVGFGLFLYLKHK